MEPDKWVQAIIGLYENPTRVSNLVANASVLIASLKSDEVVHDQS
jgi:hypothetical protein